MSSRWPAVSGHVLTDFTTGESRAIYAQSPREVRVHITRNGREYVVLLAAEDLESMEATLELLADTQAQERIAAGEAVHVARTAARQPTARLPEAVAAACVEFLIWATGREPTSRGNSDA